MTFIGYGHELTSLVDRSPLPYWVHAEPFNFHRRRFRRLQSCVPLRCLLLCSQTKFRLKSLQSEEDSVSTTEATNRGTANACE